ncbi:MAG: Clostripain family protein [Candidatus Dependentiae bacterium ADurb.Bin331]|nr:MAG: Clostripain family protein [Candidatus Dependentiae bacterium ADurb.Bin331]
MMGTVQSLMYIVCVFFLLTANATTINHITQSLEAQIENHNENSEIEPAIDADIQQSKHVTAQKEWTILTYMAADNDLAPYARKNLKQQADVGSNERINIVTQLDTRIGPHNKITKRYYIEKDKLNVKNLNDPATQRMDSGSPETLIDFCGWGIKHFPARYYMLILWNHGTGIIDIGRPRSINPLQLFFFNPETQLIELDRTIPFLDFVQAIQDNDPRAICFDDSTGHYISNQGLDRALREITQRFLGGRKLTIVAFDACLMSMIEIANIVKDYAEIMVSSQEVELGPGYDYRRALTPIAERSLNPKECARTLVKAFEQTYFNITNDFTQSAIALEHIESLEINLTIVGTLLNESLSLQYGTTVRDIIKSCRHKMLCTHFDETSYLDFHHLYSNLLANLVHFKFTDLSKGNIILKGLRESLEAGLKLIDKAVIANATGKNLNRAKGISIYFPERTLHSSYHRTKFAANNKWYDFLITYLSLP